jgi:hypothetical protein
MTPLEDSMLHMMASMLDMPYDCSALKSLLDHG